MPARDIIPIGAGAAGEAIAAGAGTAAGNCAAFEAHHIASDAIGSRITRYYFGCRETGRVAGEMLALTPRPMEALYQRSCQVVQRRTLSRLNHDIAWHSRLKLGNSQPLQLHDFHLYIR